MTIRLDRLALAALALALLPSAARAGDTEPGTYWEQTVEMQMQGMSMPAQSQKVCLPKAGISEPPKPGPGNDKSCEMTDVKRDGPKMTWKMKCTGKNAMTGEGELVSSKDGYTGKMDMHMAQGDMTMKMKGKLLGGDCDAAAVKKQVAAAQKQQQQVQEDGEKQMNQLCQQGADEMSLELFAGPVVTCKKPEQVAMLCASAVKRPGFLSLQRQARGNPEAKETVKRLCKKDPDAPRAGLCAQAMKETNGDKTPDEVLDFLGDQCPDEARKVAKKECAGRKFTGIPESMRKVCVKYAKDEMGKKQTRPASDEEEADEAPPKKETKDKAMDAGKSLLKGLF